MTDADKDKIQKQLLDYLENHPEGISDSREWIASIASPKDHEKLVGVLLGLESHEIVKTVNGQVELVELTEHGKQIAELGSSELKLWQSLESAIAMTAIDKNAFAEAAKNKWVAYDKITGTVRRVVENEPEDLCRSQLRQLVDRGAASLDPKVFKALCTRKVVSVSKIVKMNIQKGPKFSAEGPKKLELDITTETLQNPELWKDPSRFKPLNFDAMGLPVSSGKLHPLMQVRQAFREILLEMGFSEMPTNRYVESAFWNFDALFQPQQHPARDAHDTFFLTTPSTMNSWPEDYAQRVKNMHERGFEVNNTNSSIGWRYDWKESEAKKNILRTHTTAVSARMLYELSRREKFTPVRLFSIDRVFRNETLDATHLAEFHQIEGVVADYGLTLGDLMGTITQFFQKWGLTDLRFKPAYNPYTEPSMEIFAYHPGLGKWVEIGNSGMFRPEMLTAMGFPPDVRVIAWGLGLERPTMIRYQLNNIRSLVGSEVSLDFVEKSALCDIQLDDKFDPNSMRR